MYRKLLPTLLALFYISAVQADLLKDGFTAHYDVSHNGIALGVAERQLVKKNNHTYEFSSTTRAEGIVKWFFPDTIVETSILLERKNRLFPLKYTYSQTGGKKEKHISLVFDWDRLRLEHSTHPELNKLTPNSHDMLGFQMTLSRGLSENKHQFDLSVIDHKRIRTYHLRKTGMETFSTSQGELNTIKLEQEKRPNHYWFSFWFAPEYQNLPVIIRKTEHDGDVSTLRLRQFNGTPIRFKDATDSDD